MTAVEVFWWTPSVQPLPSSCSSVRPVKSSHPLLKKVQSLSGSDIQIITGRIGYGAKTSLAFQELFLCLFAECDVARHPPR